MVQRAADGFVYDVKDLSNGAMVTLEGNVNARHISVLLWRVGTAEDNQPLVCTGGRDFTQLHEAIEEFNGWE